MTNDDYIKLIEKYPNLTAHGFGIEVERGSKYTVPESWDQMRQELINAHKEFEYCSQWIGDFYDLVPGNSAYHLKHVVEKWLDEKHMKPDYIPQGAFILAALHERLQMKRIPDDLGVFVG